ncbi:endonuclease [Thalassospira marina]|uniref:Uncharacterized protein n=1 Tax=Thalassospira marina TaxID=2048283 RepID=A0A2N3KIQ4_9PROT|nr:hypothetical protein COO20_21065 [Thalassospira marina]
MITNYIKCNINNDRYAVIPGEGHEFGACTAQDSKGTFEPRDSEKGDVARIWLYMHDRYGVVFQIGELEMFQSWNETDPVSDWEIERDRRIVQVQGFGNP